MGKGVLNVGTVSAWAGGSTVKKRLNKYQTVRLTANLATVAIGKQISFEDQAKSMEPMIDQQNQVVEQLKDGLNQMKERLS